MNTSLDSLDPVFRPVAIELLARCTEAKILILVVNCRRTDAEQALAVSTGHSQVTHSKHQDGLAIDICPFATWQLHGEDKLQWDVTDPVWLRLGAIGEHLGLRWGGRFHPLNRAGIGWDPGHFELNQSSSVIV